MLRGGKTSWYNKLMTFFAHCIHAVERHAIAYSSVSAGCVTFVCVFLFMCVCVCVFVFLFLFSVSFSFSLSGHMQSKDKRVWMNMIVCENISKLDCMY